MAGMALAKYKVQLAWGKSSGIADVAPLWTATTWTGGANTAYNAYVDITSLTVNKPGDTGVDFTQPITISRGMDPRLTSIQEGALTVPVRDPTGLLSPLNGASPLAGKLIPRIGILVTCSLDNGATWNPLCQMWTRRFSRIPDKIGHGTITAYDLIRRLSKHDNAGILIGTLNTTSDVLTALIAKLPWTYTRFSTGINVQQSSGLQNNFAFSDSLLNVIQGAVDPSLGKFFIGRDGTAVYLGKGNANHSGAVQATVTNVMTAVPSEVDEDLIYNEAIATMTRPGQANFTPQQQSVNDATSRNQYGKNTWNLSSPWWASNGDALSAANYILSKYKTPINRVRTVTLNNRDAATLSAMVLVDIGDVVTIAEARDGTSANYVVWGITHNITMLKHETTWVLAPGGL